MVVGQQLIAKIGDALDSKTLQLLAGPVQALALRSLGRFCSNIEGPNSAVIDAQVLGPPDIEQKVGLTGGHIFQGECLPPYMWSKRLAARTPMPGFYMCGACTHPGGSVIGINGRNAAMAVLADSAAQSRMAGDDYAMT